MATKKLGNGDGKYITGLLYLDKTSGDIENYSPAVITFKDGKKVSVFLFACDTVEDINRNVVAMENYVTSEEYKGTISVKAPETNEKN